MSRDESNITNLYSSDEYIEKNPNIHEEDSPWKITKITPLIDEYLMHEKLSEMNLLDVGGGAGIILKEASSYIRKTNRVQVNKLALDLSPGMLEIQNKNNPDLVKALNEDIKTTSLRDKEIDLTLMIDVLEHIPNPIEALDELQRISKYIIFKVPLEDNLFDKVQNFVRGGKPRQHAIDNMGHINVYRFSTLKRQLQKDAGLIINSYFTNAFDYYRSSTHYQQRFSLKHKLINRIAGGLFKLSPYMTSVLFGDFAMILVKTRNA